ncbi:MAG: hypothetical protein MI724_02615 [Spirochaetales bacterium]|nr:hypothetical protein [Spirochaetales bacterium]
MGSRDNTIIVVADDLTGANDTGVQFAKRGIVTDIVLPASGRDVYEDGSGRVSVVDTESRFVSADEAYRRVRSALDGRSIEDATVYKKIDSTMRGNVGAEIRGALEAVGARYAVVVPAYPANGRTTRRGRCFVNGVPVSQTELARDPRNPVVESDIGATINAQFPCHIERVGIGDAMWHSRSAIADATCDRPVAVVFDAETDADLQRVWNETARYSSEAIYVGSAGLAQYVGTRSRYGTDERAGAPRSSSQGAGVLFAIGSVNRRTLEQSRALPPSIPRIVIDLPTVPRDRDDDDVVERLTTAFSTGRAAVLQTVEDHAAYRQRLAAAERDSGLVVDRLAEYMARRVGGIVSRVLERIPLAGLFVTGGDIAAHVLRAIGVSRIRVESEVESGVPLGTLTVDGRELGIVTKAGGFGSDEILLTVLDIFGVPR